MNLPLPGRVDQVLFQPADFVVPEVGMAALRLPGTAGFQVWSGRVMRQVVPETHLPVKVG